MEVNPNRLIEKLAEKLEKEKVVTMPDWAKFVKTGMHKERPPIQENWWYLRTASIMRKLYKYGPIGVSKLRSFYGGRKNRGHSPEWHIKGGGKIIRTILMQLEEKGLVEKKDNRGRVLSNKGIELLHKTAKELNVTDNN